MTAARCPRCDRPEANGADHRELEKCGVGAYSGVCECDPRLDALCWGGVDCVPIDWRARCLAAEASLREEESLCTTEVLARLRAEDMARDALVEGLAECERLRNTTGLCRACTGPGGVYDMLDERASRPLIPRRAGKTQMMRDWERAIRADAGREERGRVVAWLKEAVRYVEQQLDVAMCKTCGSAIHAYEYKADAIRRAVLAISDNAHAPGKGGEG